MNCFAVYMSQYPPLALLGIGLVKLSHSHSSEYACNSRRTIGHISVSANFVLNALNS
jgi:hypothetical protein